MNLEAIQEGLTFDDVLLQPAHSELTPAEADPRTRFTRTMDLNIPIVSAAIRPQVMTTGEVIGTGPTWNSTWAVSGEAIN